MVYELQINDLTPHQIISGIDMDGKICLGNALHVDNLQLCRLKSIPNPG